MSGRSAATPLDQLLATGAQTALRPEAFGAMAYHFGTRRLSFLTDPALAEVVRRLDGTVTGREACGAAGVAPQRLGAFAVALRTLVEGGMVTAVGGAPADGPRPRPAPSAPGAAAAPAPARPSRPRLADRFERGLAAPICLTWELTYACNLQCAHCLSSSGRRDPRELSTGECQGLIDELDRIGVFYVNVGGGEPTVRPDFFELVDYAVAHRVGVKFSTNGSRISPAVARRLAASDYVDVQVSLDGATPEVNDAIRGEGSYAVAVRAMEHLSEAGFTGFKISVVMTRHNVGQLNELEALARRFGAQLRLTRLRPSGRGAEVWESLRLTPDQQRALYHWLQARGDTVLTGDSFFHLSGYGDPLPGLNLCGAGKVVCLVDPVGDVYACPFTIHDDFRAGNVRADGGFTRVWREAGLFRTLRTPAQGGACRSCSSFSACRGGCMAAKFFTGTPLDAPDPECVRGHAVALAPPRVRPRPSADHSRRATGPVAGRRRRPVATADTGA